MVGMGYDNCDIDIRTVVDKHNRYNFITLSS